MAHNDFSITITDKAVDVRYTPSSTSPRGKLFSLIFIICASVAGVCFVLFMPGKHNDPSMWHDLVNASSGLYVIFVPIGLLGISGWSMFRYERASCASDETFHCDSESITLSRVPWLDFSNRTWRTHTYPIKEVSGIRFAVIASTRGGAIWGLRFRADGRKWALPGLEAPEAKPILEGLKALGADVPDDPNLEKRIKEAHALRFGDTSWMDRSWMDTDKQ